MLRAFTAFVVAFGLAASSDAAELKKLVIRCVEKAEATPDDLFIEFIVDGKPIVFNQEHQAGTSRENTVSMKDGEVVTLEPATLAAVKFDKTLTIHIKDKDITRDEPIGTMNLVPGDVTSTYVTKGKDVGNYHYEVDYATTK